MKRLILTMFLAFGVLGFSRFIEECRITSKGRGYLNCVSLQTGRNFNFTRGYIGGPSYGSVYRIYFQGNGYRRLYLEGYEYLYY